MSSFEQLLAAYDYPLEKEWIAERPARPRDSAKLLVYDRATGTTRYDTFSHLSDYVPKGALLVLNDTKVMPARVSTHKVTGGKVEVLCTKILSGGKVVECLANKRLTVGEELYSDAKIAFRVAEVREKEYILNVVGVGMTAASLLTLHGTTPLPPYLKHTPLGEDELRSEYQTLFAREEGSSAAPTASLHFTHSLLESLKEHGIEVTFVTLHVGLGTFAPLTEEQIRTGRLHHEYYELNGTAISAVQAAHRAGRPIIPVGTTALRALESAFADQHTVHDRGETDIFIREGYAFRVATGLITNFHVPRSSLMMLVAALTGRERLLELYHDAHERGFRFLSFGDGMLVI